MTVNNDPFQIGLTLIVAVFFFLLGSVSAFRPHSVIRYLGRITRAYYKSMNLSEKQANRMILPGFEEMVGGSVTVFIEKSETNPQHFTSLTTYIRMFGVAFMVMAGMSLLLTLVALIALFTT